MPLLTQNFSVNELSATVQPYFNVPGPIEELYLLRLCEVVLEPARELWGCPIGISSGYRSAAVNSAVGGAPDSQHLKGQAADIFPVGMKLVDAFRMLAQSGIPFDQAILENVGGKNWIHVSVPPIYRKPRREALTTQDGLRWAVYELPREGDNA